MAKLIQPFQFSMPINKQSTTGGRLCNNLIGHLEIDAVATLYFAGEPDIDFNSIKWNGVDIFLLLDNMSAADEMMQQIIEAAKTFLEDTLTQNINNKNLVSHV